MEEATDTSSFEDVVAVTAVAIVVIEIGGSGDSSDGKGKEEAQSGGRYDAVHAVVRMVNVWKTLESRAEIHLVLDESVLWCEWRG